MKVSVNESEYKPEAGRGDGIIGVHEIRAEVVEFAIAMEAKLRKHDHKTTWKGKPIEALKRLLLLEIEEFKVAHEFFDADEATAELVDIGNYALILRDRIRIEKETTKN